MSAENPRITTPAAELGRLLSGTPSLVDYSFSSDDMVARAVQYSLVRGSIPDIKWSTMSPPLPLDCKIGEPCELDLKTIIGVNYVPMNSSEPPQHPQIAIRCVAFHFHFDRFALYLNLSEYFQSG